MKEAKPGKNLQLTIDLDLQVVAELAMEGKMGAVVALDPRNGEILAMVSRPAFDPNKFAVRIQSADWKSLTSDPDNPLLNRAIQAQLAPGSTFKPLMALAGLETGAIDDSFTAHCGGAATFYGHLYHCWHTHGSVQLHYGIVQSCDVYFYNVGNRMGIDNIALYAEEAGFGQRTGVDLPGEAEGIVPSSQWKIRNFREKWYAGETISVSIGQGALTVTPIQLAHAHRRHRHGRRLAPAAPGEGSEEKPREAKLDPANVQKVVDGMYGVVNEGGTGVRAQLPGIEVCGKTGSAQVVSNELAKGRGKTETRRTTVGLSPSRSATIRRSWWRCYSSVESMECWPRPMARDVIKAYYDKKARLGLKNEPGVPRTARPVEPVPLSGE